METNCYRQMLQKSLAEKLYNNPQLSMRALALKAGVSHSLMSQVLSGKKNLSRESAIKLADFFGYSDDATEQFVTLVEIQKSKDPSYKMKLLEKLSKRQLLDESLQLELEKFQIISRWYHLPIIEMSRLKNADLSIENISQRLGISKVEARDALDRLVMVGALSLSQGSYQAKGFAVVRSPGPNPQIRDFHRTMIEKALKAQKERPLDERCITGTTLAISKEDVPKAQELIQKFKEDLRNLVNGNSNKDSVYQTNIQFFELTKLRVKKET